VYFAIAGIIAEVVGFVIIWKSSRKLEFQEGDFVSDRYVDPKTGKPPPKIEGPPDPRLYRPGLYLVISGLISQGIDVFLNQILRINV
jgi:hypothetical protein